MRGMLARFLAPLMMMAVFALTIQPGLSQDKNILAEVLKRGTIRIAIQGGVPPYSVLNANNEPEGYDIDIGKAIADALKVKPEWVIVDTPGRITALQTGKADITIADFTANVERSKVIAFTDPYLVVGMVFTVSAARADIKTVDDLNKPEIKVGFGRGSTQEQIVPSVLPKATIVHFSGQADTNDAMLSGRIDAIALDNLGTSGLMTQFPDKLKILPGSFSREDIAVGLPAGDFDWWRVLNEWMHQFNATGDNAKLFKKWFGYELPPIQAKY
jgi:polar amino acid transport system substrate-binding protein